NCDGPDARWDIQSLDQGVRRRPQRRHAVSRNADRILDADRAGLFDGRGTHFPAGVGRAPCRAIRQGLPVAVLYEGTAVFRRSPGSIRRARAGRCSNAGPFDADIDRFAQVEVGKASTLMRSLPSLTVAL